MGGSRYLGDTHHMMDSMITSEYHLVICLQRNDRECRVDVGAEDMGTGVWALSFHRQANVTREQQVQADTG